MGFAQWKVLQDLEIKGNQKLKDLAPERKIALVFYPDELAHSIVLQNQEDSGKHYTDFLHLNRPPW